MKKQIIALAVAITVIIPTASMAYMPSEKPFNSIESLVCRIWPSQVRWCSEQPDYVSVIEGLQQEIAEKDARIAVLENRTCQGQAIAVIDTPTAAKEGENLLFFSAQGNFTEVYLEADYGEGFEFLSDVDNYRNGYQKADLRKGTAVLRIVAKMGQVEMSDLSEEFEVK